MPPIRGAIPESTATDASEEDRDGVPHPTISSTATPNTAALIGDLSRQRSHRRRNVLGLLLESHHALDAVAIQHQPHELQVHLLVVAVVHGEPEHEIHLVALRGPDPAHGEI